MLSIKNTSARPITFYIAEHEDTVTAHKSFTVIPGEDKVVTLKQLDYIRSTPAGKAIVDNEAFFRIYGEDEERKAAAVAAASSLEPETYIPKKK